MIQWRNGLADLPSPCQLPTSWKKKAAEAEILLRDQTKQEYFSPSAVLPDPPESRPGGKIWWPDSY